MSFYGVNSGWANSCGTQLFTIGWVPCEARRPGGAHSSGGHGAVIRVPLKDIQLYDDDAELAALAMIAIEAYYGEHET
jgi:hypothetical protein